MKIIKEGKIPAPALPWWVNQTLKCSNCQTSVLMEAGDHIIVEGSERRPNGKRYLKVECPTCKRDIYHVEQAMHSAIPGENVEAIHGEKEGTP